MATVMRSILTEKGIQGHIRICLHYSGCCSPTLYLCAGSLHETDLIQELDGLVFAMEPETFGRVGEVTISCAEDVGKNGFVLTSSTSPREWGGFSDCSIRVFSFL
ncbi:MAG: hypothetical protein ACP5G0_03415 [Desulfomonilia bacterium]